MDSIILLEALEDLVSKSPSIPLWGKAFVDKENILDIIMDIKLKLPDEIKQAKWVKEERQRILLEAQKEASTIVKDAENKIITMINEHEITKKAYEQGNEIVESARQTAREIKLGTKEYADNILERLEEILRQTLDEIHNNRQELR
jgi:vacuolar-type H+-ATPase subunit H